MPIYSSCKALIIGISRYRDPQYDLSYARSDAESLADVLGAEFGFDPIWTLFDDYATRHNIIDFFEQDLQRTNEDDGLLIFFAGHGITVTSAIGDDRGFLVPYDGNPEQPYANISLTIIRDDYLPMIPAKHVFLIVDACYGGLALRDVAAAERPRTVDEALLAELTRRDRKVRQVLAAGGRDQKVLDGGLFGHSLFTGRLIEALHEANPYVTADRVGPCVRERVARDAADRRHRQTPQFGYLFGGDGSFVFHRRAASTGSASSRRTGKRPEESHEGDKLAWEVPDDLERLRAQCVDDVRQGERCFSLGRNSDAYLVTAYTQRFPLWKEAADRGIAEGMLLLGDCCAAGRGVAEDKAEGVKWYRKAAEQGNASAQNNLGYCYQHGEGVAEDKAEGVKWYRKAADQGYASAQYNLAYCYQHGDGVAQNKAEAVKWYRKAADQGNANAQDSLGDCCQCGEGVPEDKAEAARWYRKAADQGHAAAQNSLALCYDHGKGVAQDKVQAAKWYRKAAEQGHAAAQNNLGYCYQHGEGVPQDEAEGVKWYRKAADQGNASAQYNLAYCYQHGEGVAQSKAEAVKWYRKAADQGNANAQDSLGDCCQCGEGVAEHKAEGVKWYRKAAEQGNASAQYNLGYCYQHGEGVAEDKAEAVKWYRKAAEQGSEYAQNSLGECYYYGNGVGQNEAEAVEWFRKAAEQENEYAQNSLGECYYNGKGVGQNKAEAVMWSRKAAEQGNPDAQNRLGVCYQYGEGIDKDDTEAVKWYREAADQGNVKAQYNLALCFDQGIGVARNTRAAVTWYRRAAEQGDADAQNRLNALATRAAAPSTQETTLATTPAPVVAASQAPPARNPPNLRLTLRNLLAHMDGLLDTKDSQEIGKKLEGSKFGTDLFHEIREVMRRPSLPAPSITERGANLDCNTVAEYLDHELPGDRVPDFEDVIFKSEMRLAEVASCHQILTMALGEPAEIEPESRQRMYQLPDVAKGNNTVQLDHDNTKGK